MRRTSFLFLTALLAVARAARRSSKRTEVRDDEIDDPHLPSDMHLFGAGLTLQQLQECERGAGPATDRSTSPTGERLAFITPWNAKGYAYAEAKASRLTFLSPVWYQVREDNPGRLVLTGGHDFDGAWLARVRNVSRESDGADTDDSCAATGSIKVVPRVLSELTRALTSSDVSTVADLLTSELIDKGYDGYCLEMPIDNIVYMTLLERLRKELPRGSTLISAVPAYQTPSGRGPPQMHVTLPILNALSRWADRIVIMVYDYGLTRSGVPNAPLPWARQVIDSLGAAKRVRRKVLIGVPAYGYVDGAAEISPRILEVAIRGGADCDWHEQWLEHVLHWNDASGRHEATLPTPTFVHARMELARSTGLAGIAIWELGQSLQCMLNIL